ncbi:MAG TPA: hypothetical protein VF456_01465 [Vicinamibacterales bacterium]
MTANSGSPGTAAPPSLPAIIAPAVGPRGLQLRTDLAVPGWMFWELRTLNRHRVVGLLKARRAFATAQDLNDEIRGVLGREFKRAWWRGIAYGAVVQVDDIALKPDDMKTLVDVRENEKGDLQWVILVAADCHVAIGVHTWIEAFLSPAYRAILLSLESMGCQVNSVRREKDGLMKFLTGVANLEMAIHTLGQKKVMFREFQNISTAAGASDTGPRTQSTATNFHD